VSQTKTSACCCDDRKCPRSCSDFGPRQLNSTTTWRLPAIGWRHSGNCCIDFYQILFVTEYWSWVVHRGEVCHVRLSCFHVCCPNLRDALMDIKEIAVDVLRNNWVYSFIHSFIGMSILVRSICRFFQKQTNWNFTLAPVDIFTYSTVALVPPMSTMYVWRGIT